MKTDYAEAEKQCESGDRNGTVADFNTRFTTYPTIGVITQTIIGWNVKVHKHRYNPRYTQYYEESMVNLRWGLLLL